MSVFISVDLNESTFFRFAYRCRTDLPKGSNTYEKNVAFPIVAPNTLSSEENRRLKMKHKAVHGVSLIRKKV